VCDVPANGRCPLCNKADHLITPSGGHVLACCEAGAGGARGMRVVRHNSVLSATIDGMKKAIAPDRDDIHVTKEPHLQHSLHWVPKGPLTNVDDPAHRADVSYWITSTGRRRTADLVITHPQASVDPTCATKPGKAASAAAFRKQKAYDSKWHVPEGNFVPLAIETGGRMDPAYRSFLSDYMKLQKAGEFKEWEAKEKAKYAADIKYMLTSISVALVNATGRALLRLIDRCNRLRAPVVIGAGNGAGAGAGGAVPA
jgi:hypothetical protein